MAYDALVNVQTSFSVACSLTHDEGASLDDYMRLPVDQCVCIRMPLDATLERVAGSRSNLTVPPVGFFTLDVSQDALRPGRCRHREPRLRPPRLALRRLPQLQAVMLLLLSCPTSSPSAAAASSTSAPSSPAPKPPGPRASGSGAPPASASTSTRPPRLSYLARSELQSTGDADYLLLLLLLQSTGALAMRIALHHIQNALGIARRLRWD